MIDPPHWKYICIRFQFGVQLCDSFIPTLGYKGPKWVPVELICLSVSMSLCLSVHLVFIVNFC